MKLFRIFSYIVLLLLICFHALNNYEVITRDQSPVLGEQLTNYVKSKNLYQIISGQESFINNFRKEEYGLKGGVYPPLIYFNALLFYTFFPLSYKISMLSNVTFFIMLIIFSFKLTEFLTDTITALFAAVLISFLPSIFGFSRIYHADFALIALVTMNVYFLFKSEIFNNKQYSLLLGIGMGLGMLCKQSFALFFVSLFMFVLYRSKFQNLKSIAAIVLLAAAVAMPWYLVNFNADIGFPSWAVSSDFYFFKKISFLSSYISDLAKYHLGNFLFVLFIISLVMFLFFVKHKYKIEIFLWFMAPLLLFSFGIGIYSTRYILALLPVCVMIIAMVIHEFRMVKKLRLLLFALMLILAIRHYWQTSYPEKAIYFNVHDINLREDKNGLQGIRAYQVNMNPLYDTLAEYKREVGSPLKILALFNTLDADYMRFEILTKQPAFDFNFGLMLQALYGLDVESTVLAHDVVLVKSEQSNFLHHPELYPRDFVEKMQKLLQNFRETPPGFKYLKKVQLNFAGQKDTYLVYINNKLVV